MIKNVILDFGHGGLTKDGRYTTAPNKMFTHQNGEVALEGVLNRQIGGHVYTCLRSHQELNVNCTVKEDDPIDLSLQARVNKANKFDPKSTIFVSIHCNASRDHSASGFEIFTSEGLTESDNLATSIVDSVMYALKRYDVRLRADWSDGDVDKEAKFFVLSKTKCPAVLIECGFFDNWKEYVKLKDPLYQADLGSFIYTGIINYIHAKNKQ